MVALILTNSDLQWDEISRGLTRRPGPSDAEPGVGEVVELGDRGFVLVKVFPGSVNDNRFRLPSGLASAS